MSSTVTEKANVILEDMPPYLADEPLVRDLVNACAREFQRIEDSAQKVLDTMFPADADDTYGLLSLWEMLLGLPVNPPGVSVVDRQSSVLSSIRSRNARSGAEWVALISDGLDQYEWTHEEGPGPYVVTIRIPYAPGSFTPSAVETLARKITPAHLVLQATFNEGFILGVDVTDGTASPLD